MTEEVVAIIDQAVAAGRFRDRSSAIEYYAKRGLQHERMERAIAALMRKDDQEPQGDEP